MLLRLYLKIIFIFISKLCFTQSSLRPIRYLTTDNGLSQAINYSILKDSKDFVWITSYDGLNRFDSRKIITYRNQIQDSGSFKGTLSIGVIEDENNNIWCGSNDALNIYNKKTNSFKQIKVQGNANDLYIPIISFNKKVIFKRGNSIFTCDINSLQTSIIKIDSKIDILKFTPKIFETENSILIFFISKPLISSSNFTSGYTIFEIQKSNITKGKILKNQQDEIQYYDVIKSIDNNFIFATSKGFLQYNLNSSVSNTLNSLLNTKKIIALAKVNNGILLSIKKEGLWFYNISSNILTKLNYSTPIDEEELKKYDAEILYVDKNNFLWLSLWGKGIGYVDLSPVYFNTYFTDANLQQGKIKDKYIVSIKCNKDGYAWLSTKTDGIYKVDKLGNILMHIPYPSLVSQISFGDTYIFNGHNNELFIGSQLGIYKVDELNKKLQKIDLVAGGQILNGINDILAFDKMQYLISTQTGLYESDINFSNLKLLNDLCTNEVILRTIVAKNYLLVCRPFVGVKIYKIKNGFELYDSITLNTSIKHVYAAKDSNVLWLASTIGVLKYNIETKKSTLINHPDLLSNTYTYSVLPDSKNNLWISHNKGITEYNIASNSSKHFTKSHGLQGNEFNTNAFDKSLEGTMFFGGTNGLNIFNPSNADSAITPSTLQIIDFKINDENQASKYSLSNFDTLKLAYKQNAFSLIPLIINYFNSDDDECLYKIEGVDNTWLEGKSNALIRYSNLPTGKYNFLIKPKNSNSLTTIFIIVEKPFWLSIWFFLLLIGAASLLVWYIIRSYYLRKVKKHKAELEKQMAVEHERTRIATDMHDDLGSGLTKITYLSQMALNKQDSKEDLQNIKNTSTHLVESMSEIIWAMKEENNTIEDLIYYIKTYVTEYCASNNLNCTISIPDKLYPRIVAGQNRRNIYLAVKETLHNIVKHAKAKNVSLSAMYDKEWVLKIKDDGVGFNTDKTQPHIGGNGLKNITKRIEAVRGKVEIINNNGTEVIFYIPL